MIHQMKKNKRKIPLYIKKMEDFTFMLGKTNTKVS